MEKRTKTRDMVLTALFIALVFLLGLTPIGLIPLGFINVTVLCIPVVVGTILFGLKVGLLLGGCMGTVSLMSVLGLSLTPPSGLAAALLAVSPVLAVLMCFVPRLLIPVATHFVYCWAARGKAESKLGIAPAAVAGSLTNTVFYLGMMLLFYVMAGLDSKPILALIGGVALIAGSLEAVAAAVIATPVVIALRKARLAGKPPEPQDEQPERGARD